MTPPYTAAAYFIFDVESIGLHGDAFAVAAQVFDCMGEPILGKVGWWYSIAPQICSGTPANHEWVRYNVPDLKPEANTAQEMRQRFWDEWQEAKKEFPGIVIAAECAWPVEARFLHQCIADAPYGREFAGPYPLHDIASIMAAAGMDPLATYERVHEERDLYPPHHPLGDVKHSAWCLSEALKRLKGTPA